MNVQYQNLGVLAQFTFGILAAVVFNFFAHNNVVLGLILGVAVSLVALSAAKADVREDIAALKNFPRNFMLFTAEVRAGIKTMPGSIKDAAVAFGVIAEEYLSKALRQARQKKLLRRNRLTRERRLLSAS